MTVRAAGRVGDAGDAGLRANRVPLHRQRPPLRLRPHLPPTQERVTISGERTSRATWPALGRRSRCWWCRPRSASTRSCRRGAPPPCSGARRRTSPTSPSPASPPPRSETYAHLPSCVCVCVCVVRVCRVLIARHARARITGGGVQGAHGRPHAALQPSCAHQPDQPQGRRGRHRQGVREAGAPSLPRPHDTRHTTHDTIRDTRDMARRQAEYVAGGGRSKLYGDEPVRYGVVRLPPRVPQDALREREQPHPAGQARNRAVRVLSSPSFPSIPLKLTLVRVVSCHVVRVRLCVVSCRWSCRVS